MALRPAIEVYELGRDQHGRMWTLKRSHREGRIIWDLHREAANQRDESAVMYDVPPSALDTIRALANEGKF